MKTEQHFRCCISLFYLYQIFFISYFAVQRPTLGHPLGSLTHQIIITILFAIQSEGHWEPRNEVESYSLAKSIDGIQAGNTPILRIWKWLDNMIILEHIQKNISNMLSIK